MRGAALLLASFAAPLERASGQETCMPPTTQAECEAGNLVGPFSPEELEKEVGKLWIAARRFAVRQGEKLRLGSTMLLMHLELKSSVTVIKSCQGRRNSMMRRSVPARKESKYGCVRYSERKVGSEHGMT